MHLRDGALVSGSNESIEKYVPEKTFQKQLVIYISFGEISLITAQQKYIFGVFLVDFTYFLKSWLVFLLSRLEACYQGLWSPVETIGASIVETIAENIGALTSYCISEIQWRPLIIPVPLTWLPSVTLNGDW